MANFVFLKKVPFISNVSNTAAANSVDQLSWYSSYDRQVGPLVFVSKWENTLTELCRTSVELPKWAWILMLPMVSSFVSLVLCIASVCCLLELSFSIVGGIGNWKRNRNEETETFGFLRTEPEATI